MKTFYHLLLNTLLANLTNNFLWFAVAFWAYIETQSVLATAIIGGAYSLLSAIFGLPFGTFVDRHKKKSVMLVSSIGSLISFVFAAAFYFMTPKELLLNLAGIHFWIFVLLVLLGAVLGSMRMLALSTTVTLLVPADRHDRANGLVGTANGISFALTSVFSGIVIGQLGMGWALSLSVCLTVIVGLHLLTVHFDELPPQIEDSIKQKPADIKGALTAIMAVPGLLAIILFATFNNFLGGVFMTLMDPYGLTLVSVEIWGVIWGLASFGFIIGGVLIAKWGLGQNPLRTLFIANILVWGTTVIFPIQNSVTLLIAGIFSYMLISPYIEASEQTIIQRVVPFSKQGRVFGFAQAVETAAAPITAFMVGPIAEFIVIPFMSVRETVPVFVPEWFGFGPGRGMALILVSAGIIGLLVTVLVMRSRMYKELSEAYAAQKHVPIS